MRRTLVFLFALAGLAVAASPASAAGWTGVVIAKDSSRKAVVTASADGTVRTTRSPKAASLRLGQRLLLSGTKRADGTYRATSVRVTGRASTTRVKAVVIRNQRAQRRLLVSAGGSSFALLRRNATRSLATRTDAAPKPGDQIVATVALASGTLRTTALTTVGHVGTIEVEGIVTKIADGSIELVVAKSGFVTISLPSGLELPLGLKAFDEAKLIVSVGSDGKLTAIAVQAEHEDEAEDEDDNGVDLDEDSHELEIEGKITALSATSITVKPGLSASPVTCSLSKSLSGFAVGDLVELECVAAAAGALVLRKIELQDDEHEDDDDDEHEDDDDDEDDDEDDDDDDDDDNDDQDDD